ncbi:MAG: hypothetical protein JWR44_2471 [Hymenobacter sp.]|nr:hypothetical protein [Hymenobacter sp.]
MTFFANKLFLLSASGMLLASLLSLPAQAQSAAPIPSFYATYNYTGYTVYDTTSPEPPTVVRGVGGSLSLRADGTYEKHMSIVAPAGPHYFNQTGRFTLAGDSIRFAFTDLKGADVQRGTFQFDPSNKHLTITILGYPEGNKGVYELVAAEPKPTPPAARPKGKAPKKRAR